SVPIEVNRRTSGAAGREPRPAFERAEAGYRGPLHRRSAGASASGAGSAPRRGPDADRGRGRRRSPRRPPPGEEAGRPDTGAPTARGGVLRLRGAVGRGPAVPEDPPAGRPDRPSAAERREILGGRRGHVPGGPDGEEEGARGQAAGAGGAGGAPAAGRGRGASARPG